MIADPGDSMQSCELQREQRGSETDMPTEAHQTSSKMQHEKTESSSGHISDETLGSNTSTGIVSTKKHRNLIDLVLRPSVRSTITQSSKLVNLPTEIQRVIYDFVFDGEDSIINLRRGTQRFILDWGHHLSILLSCRDINNIAMWCLRRRATTIDLRQHRKDVITNPLNTISSLKSRLSQNPKLMAVSTKLMLSQDQYILAEELQELMPALSHVELYEYATREDDIRRNLAACKTFEYSAPQIMKTPAETHLIELRGKLPPNVAADLIFVSDTLICIPEHESDSAPSDQPSKSRRPCVHTENWRCLLKMPCNWCKKEEEREEKKRKEKAKEREQLWKSGGEGEEASKEPIRYKTAKLRHAILFNESNPEGTYFSKDWVVSGLSRGPSFAFGGMLGIHCHDYCLELINRGQTTTI